MEVDPVFSKFLFTLVHQKLAVAYLWFAAVHILTLLLVFS